MSIVWSTVESLGRLIESASCRLECREYIHIGQRDVVSAIRCLDSSVSFDTVDSSAVVEFVVMLVKSSAFEPLNSSDC